MPNDCPFPLVESALAPYIHSRQQTLAIRQNLNNELVQHVRRDAAPVSHLAITTPASDLSASEDAHLPHGVYERYLAALIAHRRAQQQYDDLKAELAALREPRNNEKEEDKGALDPNLKEYIDLLRLRRKHGQLEVLQAASTQVIENEPNPAQSELKYLLQSQLGEPPDPPALITQKNEGSAQSIEQRVLQLKKDLILANSRLLEAEKRSAENKSKATQLAEPTQSVQLAALRATRDELIQWVEAELGKISEDESVLEEADVAGSQHNQDAQRTAKEIETEVASLYQCYVDSRVALIHRVHHVRKQAKQWQGPEKHSANNGEIHSPRTVTDTQIATQTSSALDLQPADLLSYLPSLIAASRHESALLAQTTHLRHQIATADQETQKSLQRLAGESYLVPPDVDSASAWHKAATDANKKTVAHVDEQVAMGFQSLQSAKESLAKLARRREAVQRLKGNIA